MTKCVPTTFPPFGKLLTLFSIKYVPYPSQDTFTDVFLTAAAISRVLSKYFSDICCRFIVFSTTVTWFFSPYWENRTRGVYCVTKYTNITITIQYVLVKILLQDEIFITFQIWSDFLRPGKGDGNMVKQLTVVIKTHCTVTKVFHIFSQRFIKKFHRVENGWGGVEGRVWGYFDLVKSVKLCFR